MRMNGGSRTPIGIDVGGRTIKAAQLRLSGARHQLAAVTILTRAKIGQDIDREEAANLRRTVRRQGFYGNEIVLAAPEEVLLRGILELPRQVSGAPTMQIARMELSRVHGVAPDSFEMACWESPPSDKSKSTAQAIAIGCPHEAANAFIDIFESAGLSVCALDTRTAAAARACAPMTLPAPAVTSILDLEWSSTQLLLVRGEQVIYERFLEDIHVSTLASALSEKFGIEQQAASEIVYAVGLAPGAEKAQADEPQCNIEIESIRKILRSHFDTVLEELKATFAYANHQYPGDGIQRMLAIGEGAGISGLAQYLHSALPADVMPAAPGDLIEGAPHILTKGANPAATVAVGLAKFAGQ